MGLQEHRARGRTQAARPWREPSAVAQLLREQNYSLQSNRKLEEGEDHPDRDAQFRHINECVKRALAAGEPVISVDTKKKELVGNYANSGQQWRVAKQPRSGSRGTTFRARSAPGLIPTASSTWGCNTRVCECGHRPRHGSLCGGLDPWLVALRRPQTLSRYAHTLLITADGGGSNGWRLRLWKLELQGFRGRKRPAAVHLPLSARHQQME